MVTGKRNGSLSQTHSDVDLHETLNIKRNREGDLREKFLTERVTVIKTRIPKKINKLDYYVRAKGALPEVPKPVLSRD